MPITKSAKKAARASIKKREFNVVKKYKIKNAYKELRKALVNKVENLTDNIARVYSSIDKAVKTNLIHKKTAARRKSRLIAMIKRETSSK